MKAVKADNGGEYKGPFKDYCKLHEIKLKKTPTKILQLIGVVERMNGAKEKRIRCMLTHAKLLKYFRGKTMRIVVDIINLSPLDVLDTNVPNRVGPERCLL